MRLETPAARMAVISPSAARRPKPMRMPTSTNPVPQTELPGVLVIGEVVSLADVIARVAPVPLAERSL